MALVRERDVEVTGDLGGRKIEMRLDENSLAHIIGAIANLYSDIKKAIIRELTTNAIDSHLEAGNENPVSITTPSSWHPELVIQDWGVGMDAEGIENVWGKVGASTKRESNIAAGQLGFGSKSPLAYGSRSMTIVAVKDGIKTMAVTGADASHGGMIEILSETKTDEPNGYKVTIPVSNRNDHEAFKDLAIEFQKYSRFPVNVNGVGPKLFDSKWIGDTFREFAHSGWNYYGLKDYIVMGNVAYPIKDARLHDRKSVAIYVEMNEVDFAPSREELQYTAHTMKTIHKYTNLYYKDQIAHAQKRIDDCSDHSLAYARSIKERNEFPTAYRGSVKFTYDGEEVPTSLIRMCQVSYNSYLNRATNVTEYSQVGRDTPSSVRYIGSNIDGLVICNFHNVKFSKDNLLKAIKYCEENDISARTFFTTDYEVGDEAGLFKWYPSSYTFVDWDDIKVIKLSNVKRKKKKGAREYEGVGLGNTEWVRFAPDKTKNIYYTNRQKIKNDFNWQIDLGNVRRLGDDDNQVFLVIDSQIPKFLQEFPNAKPVRLLAENKLEEYLNNLTQEDRDSIEKIDRYSRYTFPVDRQRILDRELRDAINSGMDDGGPLEELEQAESLTWFLPQADREKYTEKLPQPGQRAADFSLRYPLLPRYVNPDIAENALLYVNETYKQLQKENN